MITEFTGYDLSTDSPNYHSKDTIINFFFGASTTYLPVSTRISRFRLFRLRKNLPLSPYYLLALSGKPSCARILKIN